MACGKKMVVEKSLGGESGTYKGLILGMLGDKKKRGWGCPLAFETNAVDRQPS